VVALLAALPERAPRPPGAPHVALLAALAAMLGFEPGGGTAALGAAIAVAVLAVPPADRLSSECALKLTWVAGAALALSWAGVQLQVLVAGTPVAAEQWGVLRLGIDPPALWRAALPLSLLAGVVLLGVAPFHAWPADVLQGARPGAAALVVAAVQALGVAWLRERLAGIGAFADAARMAGELLGFAAVVALLGGTATLAAQRAPERRVGTLAGLNAGLALALLGAAPALELDGTLVARWTAHLALALGGAGLLARFLPSGAAAAPAAVLFRRHRVAAAAGLFTLASLAGVPGTPGARLWLDTARAVARGGDVVVLLALGAAWTGAFAVAVREARVAWGVRGTAAPEAAPVPWPLRAALVLAALGVAGLGVAWGWRG
jgi:NADH:ubiquinone oxidoreductase subunit 2 (subunit N)